MFRATILTVVLLFAAAPSVPLLCKAWCDPHTAAESGCHQKDNGGAASLRGDDSCDDSVQGPAGLPNEDIRRAPAPDGGAAVPTGRFQILATAATLVPAWSRGRASSDQKHLQTTPLRI